MVRINEVLDVGKREGGRQLKITFHFRSLFEVKKMSSVDNEKIYTKKENESNRIEILILSVTFCMENGQG